MELIDIVAEVGLYFDQAKLRVSLFHMTGCLSEYGNLGMTCLWAPGGWGTRAAAVVADPRERRLEVTVQSCPGLCTSCTESWTARLTPQAECLDRGSEIRLVGCSFRASMQRTEALSILRLKVLPGSRQDLQAIQSSNPELAGWGDLELEAYRRLWQFLPPAGELGRRAA